MDWIIETATVHFTSRKIHWTLTRDRFGNVAADSQSAHDYITDKELVSMPLDELATHLESSGW